MKLALSANAYVELYDNFVANSLELQETLIRTLDWQQREIKLYGKQVKEPRQTVWIGDPSTSYRYSGRNNIPQPWPEILQPLRKQMEEIAQAPFNSCLLNLYRDGQDSIGLHSDDEIELGLRPTIASLSLGSNRVFQIRRKSGDGVAKLDIELQHNTLLIMRGNMQQQYKHGVPKQPRVKLPRINLTFRNIQGLIRV